MTWFKIDDGFYSSKKVLSIPRTMRLSAVGLWTMAGNWSARELSDGVVPLYVLDELGATPRLRQALVTARLWLDHPEGGIEFYGWAEYQPTRDQIEERREKEREKKRRTRGVTAASPRVSPGDNPGESRGESVTPDPSRPDPATYVAKNKAINAALFDEFWAVWPRSEGKAAAVKAWEKATKGTAGAVIVAAATAYASSPYRPEKQFVPHGSTWLNGERWDDPPLEAPNQSGPAPQGPPKLSNAEQNLANFLEKQRGNREQGRGRTAIDSGELG